MYSWTQIFRTSGGGFPVWLGYLLLWNPAQLGSGPSWFLPHRHTWSRSRAQSWYLPQTHLIKVKDRVGFDPTDIPDQGQRHRVDTYHRHTSSRSRTELVLTLQTYLIKVKDTKLVFTSQIYRITVNDTESWHLPHGQTWSRSRTHSWYLPHGHTCSRSRTRGWTQVMWTRCSTSSMWPLTSPRLRAFITSSSTWWTKEATIIWQKKDRQIKSTPAVLYTWLWIGKTLWHVMLKRMCCTWKLVVGSVKVQFVCLWGEGGVMCVHACICACVCSVCVCVCVV